MGYETAFKNFVSNSFDSACTGNVFRATKVPVPGSYIVELFVDGNYRLLWDSTEAGIKNDDPIEKIPIVAATLDDGPIVIIRNALYPVGQKKEDCNFLYDSPGLFLRVPRAEKYARCAEEMEKRFAQAMADMKEYAQSQA